MTTRCYELCYILKGGATPEVSQEVRQKVAALVSEHGGKVESVDEWPLRELSYPVHKEKKGRYHFVQIHSGSSILAPLQKYLSLHEAILRHDVFRYPTTYDYLDLKKKMGVAADAEMQSE